MLRRFITKRDGGAGQRPMRFVFLLAGLLLAAGCKSNLYSGLTEVEANNMMAILIANGIDTEKSSSKEGFTISVEKREMLRAIALLKDNGLPQRQRESLGDVFKKSGLMSSPFEERVRYIYALGEEVGQTLSKIDGVVSARVHIVLPDEPDLGRPMKPSSAAVFIKHRPEIDLDFFVPQIRRLVSSAIEGLDYAAVTVVLAQAQPTQISVASVADTMEVLPGIAVRNADVGRFWQVAIAFFGFAGVLMATNAVSAYAYLRSRRGKRKPETGTAAAVMEPS
jgi:type III secretion protein J